MRNQPKVSVIIPVYNIQQHLPRCLDSVIKQTLKNIEIICINDGSTDNSLEILKEYLAKDNRIRIFNMKNGGRMTLLIKQLSTLFVLCNTLHPVSFRLGIDEIVPDYKI